MAKPLTTEDVGGYLHDLLESLKDETTPEVDVPADSTSDPAVYLENLINSLDSESHDRPGLQDSGQSFAPEPTFVPDADPNATLTFDENQQLFESGLSVDRDLMESDTESSANWSTDDELKTPVMPIDEEANGQALANSASTELPDGSHPKASEEPDRDDHVPDQGQPRSNLDVDDELEETNKVEAQEVKSENVASDEGSDEKDSSTVHYRRQELVLVPQPTGDANTIARLREVANLTTSDALTSFRSKQIIGKAYISLCCVLLFLATALLAWLFGVNTEGISRTTALISIALAAVSTGVFLGFSFVLKGSTRN